MEIVHRKSKGHKVCNSLCANHERFETSLRSDLTDRHKLALNHLRGKRMMKEFLNFKCKPYSFMFHMNTEIDQGSLYMSKINNL